MHRTTRLTVSWLAGIAGVALATSSAVAATASSTATPTAAAKPALHTSCAAPASGHVACLSRWRHGGGAAAAPAAVARPASGYGPPDIASAYQLVTTTGAGQTIAIVDAFDNPNAEADLAVYRAAWALRPCTTANGCFRKVNQRGGKVPPPADPGWGVEIALDVQAVSASCPRCKILLVEADDSSFVSIGRAVNTAVRLGANVVSNSYGGDEFNGVLALETNYYTHPGVAQVASSGDFGFGTAQVPAAFGGIIAAGGTSLTHNADGTWSETAWDGAGSGCSAWEAKPAWQHDTHCLMRTVADVSAVADPNTGFAVYDTFGLGTDNGWIVVGGTSLSSPLLAGMIGLAGNAAAMDSARHIYTHRSGLADVVGGSNGLCGGDYLCTARKGYDGPTGLGSPRGVSAL